MTVKELVEKLGGGASVPPIYILRNGKQKGPYKEGQYDKYLNKEVLSWHIDHIIGGIVIKVE